MGLIPYLAYDLSRDINDVSIISSTFLIWDPSPPMFANERLDVGVGTLRVSVLLLSLLLSLFDTVMSVIVVVGVTRQMRGVGLP